MRLPYLRAAYTSKANVMKWRNDNNRKQRRGENINSRISVTGVSASAAIIVSWRKEN